MAKMVPAVALILSVVSFAVLCGAAPMHGLFAVVSIFAPFLVIFKRFRPASIFTFVSALAITAGINWLAAHNLFLVSYIFSWIGGLGLILAANLAINKTRTLTVKSGFVNILISSSVVTGYFFVKLAADAVATELPDDVKTF